MSEDKGDCLCIKADIQGIQDAAHHRHTEMRFYHRGYIREHGGDRFAGVQAVFFKGTGKPSGPGISLGPGAADIAMDDGKAVRVGCS